MILIQEMMTLAIIGSGLVLIARQHRAKQQSQAQGGASRDLNPKAALDPKEAGRFPLVIMDAQSGSAREVVLGESSRFQHVEVVGASGTGKNWFALLPMIHQDIQRGAGVVILDPKSAMRGHIEAFAKAAGRLQDLRILDLADPERSGTYTPFLDEHASHVTERVHAAFYGDDLTPTPHYRNLAKSLLYGFFGLCHRLGVLPTLDQLRSVALDQQALAALVAKAPKGREASELRTQFLALDRKEYAAILQGLANALTDITTSRYAPLLNTTAPSVDLREVLDQGRILYVGLAADLYPTSFRRVSTLLLMDLQSSLTRRYGKNAPPVFLYLDEFADLIHPQVGALVAKAREARMGITLAHQSLGDLKRHGDALAQAIYDSTSNKVVFRLGSAESAEQIARLIGTKTVSKDLINYSLQNNGIFGGGKTPKGVTTVTGEEFIFHPNALKNQGVGEALLILQRRHERQLFQGRLLSCPEGLLQPSVAELASCVQAGPPHQALELAPAGPGATTSANVSAQAKALAALATSLAGAPSALPPSGAPALASAPPPAGAASAGTDAPAQVQAAKPKTAAAEAALKLFARSKKQDA